MRLGAEEAKLKEWKKMFIHQLVHRHVPQQAANMKQNITYSQVLQLLWRKWRQDQNSVLFSWYVPADQYTQFNKDIYVCS